MVELRSGNLLQAQTEAIVNTVNTVGVMGKGIALQFKQAFPDNYEHYERACKEGELRVGRVLTHSRGRLYDKPWYIINFPTKEHWRGRSRIEYIQAGLEDLIREVGRLGIKSIAIPPLGCGNGGLDWDEVRPLIEDAASRMPDVQVLLYEPKGAPKPKEMPVRTAKPRMTRGRALILRLLELYRSPEYRHGKLEIQKLAYLLQSAGEPLKLKYVKYMYGPYADNLNHVLQHMEGHYIRGFGDRSGRAQIYLLPEAAFEAKKLLEQDPEAERRLETVRQLIDGFETPYGMELLSTIHWLAQEDDLVGRSVEHAVSRFHDWNPRKKKVFHPEHIRIAWKRLKDLGWLDGPLVHVGPLESKA